MPPLYEVSYFTNGTHRVHKWKTSSEKHQLPVIDSIKIPLRLQDCVALKNSLLRAPLANTLLQLPNLAEVTIDFEEEKAAIYGVQALESELLQLRSAVELICECQNERRTSRLSIIVSWCRVRAPKMSNLSFASDRL